MMDTLKFVTTCNFHFPRQRRETELLEYFPFLTPSLLKEANIKISQNFHTPFVKCLKKNKTM